jgi:hypothetical protein
MYPLQASQFFGVKHFAIDILREARDARDPAGTNYKVPRERLI